MHLIPVEFDDFLASAERGERAGYARIWVPDSHLIWQDAYICAARVLAATDRVGVGLGVTNPVTRHYSVVASASATLALLHPGRFVLGIGRGDSSVRTLGMRPMPTAAYEETVRRIRALTDGHKVRTADTEIHITWQPRGVPIMMAATGPRNLQLAGALADVAQLQVGVHPNAVKWAIEQVKSGAERAGRDPAEVKISLLCAVYVSDDLAEARERCRWAPTAAANHIDAVVSGKNPDHGMPEELTRVPRLRAELFKQSYDYYERHAESSSSQASWAPADVVDDFAVLGPADRCLAKLEELAEIGVDEVVAGSMNDLFDQMDIVGEQIIPALRTP